MINCYYTSKAINLYRDDNSALRYKYDVKNVKSAEIARVVLDNSWDKLDGIGLLMSQKIIFNVTILSGGYVKHFT